MNIKKSTKKKLSLEQIKKILTSTTGHKKLVNYIKEIIKNEQFKADVQDIRERHAISFEKVREPFSSGPDIMDEVINLLDKYHLEFECFEFMMCYVTEDEFVEEFIGNMLFTEDIINTKEMLQGASEPIVEKKFPVVIRVSPYASERDILDYVKKMYSFMIQPIQDSYKEKTSLGKVKRKNEAIQLRNDFIYENRHLPHEKIMRLLVPNGFGLIDVGHIAKIISMETAKRKEV